MQFVSLGGELGVLLEGKLFDFVIEFIDDVLEAEG